MDLAAQDLGYSQPAITYQIKSLERRLGAVLFDRTPEGARLTRSGELVLDAVATVLRLMDGIQDSCRRDPGARDHRGPGNRSVHRSSTRTASVPSTVMAAQTAAAGRRSMITPMGAEPE